MYHFYLPVFFYIEQQLAAHKAQLESEGLPPRPLCFGISAPQVHYSVAAQTCSSAGFCQLGEADQVAAVLQRASVLPPAHTVLLRACCFDAPQGSGKSTLVEQLVRLLRHTGRAAVDVSIDDFYLRFEVRRV